VHHSKYLILAATLVLGACGGSSSSQESVQVPETPVEPPSDSPSLPTPRQPINPPPFRPVDPQPGQVIWDESNWTEANWG